MNLSKSLYRLEETTDKHSRRLCGEIGAYPYISSGLARTRFALNSAIWRTSAPMHPVAFGEQADILRWQTLHPLHPPAKSQAGSRHRSLTSQARHKVKDFRAGTGSVDFDVHRRERRGSKYQEEECSYHPTIYFSI